MSVNGDAMDFTRNLGIQLNEFLYEGNVRKGIKTKPTLDECLELLENLRKEAWEEYDGYKKQLGWKD